MANYCHNCGTQVSSIDKFCPKCGCSLNIQTEAQYQQPVRSNSHSTMLGIVEVMSWIWAVAIILIALVLAFAFSFFTDELPMIFVFGGIFALILIIPGILAACAARNISKRRHHTGTVILLALSGLITFSTFPIVVGLLAAFLVYIAKDDFES